ncbi:MAG: 2,3-bisphosphoglycerate-independent phosphoglycerate mutase [Oscillospiraceae bacterium]|jgi:2,3-bisphosphoglycerate-independent phosphoglycerate mutase|nr:2,3-bisphosphoglycerate-independent phosphoglycerate mutase [Oscillospiraceae bacterium]
MKKPTLLCIMDGFGLRAQGEGNAITAARTPQLDALFARYPHTSIGASGMDVGLPDGQMGNSEVGHTNIGAGRVVYQELTRITKSIADGDFYENPALLAAVENCKARGSALHLMGLLSDGGVHSHITHLYALLELAKRHGLHEVYVHALLDGRDVPPTSGIEFIRELYATMDKLGVGALATVAGRYYGMDREKKWDRVARLYNAITKGEGNSFGCGEAYAQQSYDSGVTDEFVLPGVAEDAQPLKDGDSFIFFNFRPDRAREITRAFVDPAFDGFARGIPLDLTYVCMTQYDATMPNVQVAYHPQSLALPLGEVLSSRGLTQLRIAEYTKYAHVTFFLNGGSEVVYPGEDRVLIDSPDVATYDLQPEMSAYEVAQKVAAAVQSGSYDAIMLNFANCDMVGHTGIFAAAVAAVEAVDACVGQVWAAIEKAGGTMLLTADHGNADQMAEPDGSPFTAHTTNPVPFLVAGYPCQLRAGGRLSDIAPTMLQIMGIAQPEEMTGVSLIER